MKTKKINRVKLIEFIKKNQGLKYSFQSNLSCRNLYFIGNDKENPDFQIEFISQTKKYFYTVYIRGIKNNADCLHGAVCNYLKKLNLNRNIIVDTELKVTLV